MAEEHKPQQNHLLAALPAEVQNRLFPHLELVELLLSNVQLTDLDRELEKRGLAFCRYADDCNIYVRSRAAGDRVMSGVRVFLEKVLHLQINEAKSAVARPSERKFLGFSFTAERESRIRIALESRRRLADQVRELQHRGRGRSLAHVIEDLNPLLRGWIGYFRIAETPSVLKELDSWCGDGSAAVCGDSGSGLELERINCVPWG